MQGLQLYNSLTKQLETFEPINKGFVGIYICGPTVYAEPHLGHVRGPVVFDVLHRYLKYLGNQVRFIRNITDVGHLLNDADEGEDKIAKKAKAEHLEPMEVAHLYTESYQDMLRALNILPASMEPRASGHIIEQIEMIDEILANKLAYVVNGSVYFDVKKYAESHDYGKLSGRILEDLIAGAGNEARALTSQEEKNNPADFALWKNASPEHIMKWNSPWGLGFPGWHIECSAMSRKYLGNHFDIHGGGMDLLFPHHESEIAQSKACTSINPAKYWMHHNMVTINGQKMAKSLGNGISVKQMFEGNHPLLEKAYGPNVLKFFILQAHYRGTLDFGNDALQAAEKGLNKLFKAQINATKLKTDTVSSIDLNPYYQAIFEALNDDLNTPMALASLFELVKQINLIAEEKFTITEGDKTNLIKNLKLFIEDILGLEPSQNDGGTEDGYKGLIDLILELRLDARNTKNYALSDAIRDKLQQAGYEIKDGKDGAEIIKL